MFLVIYARPTFTYHGLFADIVEVVDINAKLDSSWTVCQQRMRNPNYMYYRQLALQPKSDVIEVHVELLLLCEGFAIVCSNWKMFNVESVWQQET